MNSKKLSKSLFKNKHFLEIASLIGLLILASAFKISTNYFKENSASQKKVAALSLYLEPEKRFFEGTVVNDMTVLDALNASADAGRIKLNYFLDNKNQTRVMEINGQINNILNKEFAFYLNGRKINPLNLSKTKISPGDEIVIKFE